MPRDHPLLTLLRALDDAACDGRSILVSLPESEPELDLAEDWKAVRWNFEFQEDYAWGPRTKSDPLMYPQSLGEIAASYVKDFAREQVFVPRGESPREWLGPCIDSLAPGAFDEASRMSEKQITALFEQSVESLGLLSPACTLLVVAEDDYRKELRDARAALPEGDDFWSAFTMFCERYLPPHPSPSDWRPRSLWLAPCWRWLVDIGD